MNKKNLVSRDTVSLSKNVGLLLTLLTSRAGLLKPFLMVSEHFQHLNDGFDHIGIAQLEYLPTNNRNIRLHGVWGLITE